MNNKQRKSLEANYYLGRVEMMKKLKPYQKKLEDIAASGIKDEEGERIAKIACSILASDYLYEESVLNNKTGGYDPLIPPPM